MHVRDYPPFSLSQEKITNFALGPGYNIFRVKVFKQEHRALIFAIGKKIRIGGHLYILESITYLYKRSDLGYVAVELKVKHN